MVEFEKKKEHVQIKVKVELLVNKEVDPLNTKLLVMSIIRKTLKYKDEIINCFFYFRPMSHMTFFKIWASNKNFRFPKIIS